MVGVRFEAPTRAARDGHARDVQRLAAQLGQLGGHPVAFLHGLQKLGLQSQQLAEHGACLGPDHDERRIVSGAIDQLNVFAKQEHIEGSDQFRGALGRRAQAKSVQRDRQVVLFDDLAL